MGQTVTCQSSGEPQKLISVTRGRLQSCMHLQFLINAVKSGPKINAKGAKERKKTKEVEIILKTKKTNRPLMTPQSPDRGKLNIYHQSRREVGCRPNIKMQLHQKWVL